MEASCSVVVVFTHTYTCCKRIDTVDTECPQVQSYGSQVKWQQVLEQGEDPKRQMSSMTMTPKQTEQAGKEGRVTGP